MQKYNKVSIIIPVYNVEKYIKQCIDSAINQTYANKEIIIIDDGSTDNSYEIAKKYSSKNIKIVHKENGGQSSARNYGLSMATGEYIFFLDSDDWIEKNTIEVLVDMLENNNLDIAHIGLIRFKDRDTVGKADFLKKETQIYTQYEICKFILETKFVSRICGGLFRRELFKEINFPIDRYFEDLAVYYKIILKSKKIGINNAKLYKYRMNSNSTTMNYSIKKCKDFISSTNEMITDVTSNYKDLEEISNVVKIKNYIEVITMFDKKKDKILYSELNSYIKSKKNFIKKYYKYFNKIDRIKIKLYFVNVKLLMKVMKNYRKLMR